MPFGRQPVANDGLPASPLGRGVTRGFAVELYFDTALENQILRIWNVLARRRLGSHLIEISARPHVSLSLHASSDLEPAKLRTAIENFAQQQHPIPVSLSAIGSFPAAPVPRPLSSPTAPVNCNSHASVGYSSITSTGGGNNSTSSSPGARASSGGSAGAAATASSGAVGASSPSSQARDSNCLGVSNSSSNINNSSSGSGQPADAQHRSRLSSSSAPASPSATGPTSALFLAPVPSISLLTLHEHFQELLKRLAIPCDSNYLPGSWLPICPVAQELPEEKLFNSFQTMRSQKLPLLGHLCEIGLVEFVPSCAGADSRQVSASKSDGGVGGVGSIMGSGDGEKGWGSERNGGGMVKGHVLDHYSFTLGGDFM